MKIAIVRQRYNPFGGAERFVERALATLAAQGAEVTLITRDWAGAPAAGFRQVTCNPPYSRLLGGRAARDQSFARAVQAEIATGRYDLVQAHERIPGCAIFRAGDGVHAAWLAHRARALSPLQRLVQRYSPFHRAVLAAERALFAHPALKAVICNSQLVADEIAAFYRVDRSKLHILYNGIDTDDFHPRLAARYRTPTRAAARIPETAPLLLFVGSGFARKGVPQLLNAFAALPRPEAHLVIVGADRQLATLGARARTLGLADRVHFTGPLSDVRPWLGAADAFVLPTLYDPCPNAALEALAAGLPTLTTPTCGAREWIVDGTNGTLADPLDPAALTTALDRLCALAAQPAAHAAARAAVEHLTLDAMAARLLALYARLAPATLTSAVPAGDNPPLSSEPGNRS